MLKNRKIIAGLTAVSAIFIIGAIEVLAQPADQNIGTITAGDSKGIKSLIQKAKFTAGLGGLKPDLGLTALTGLFLKTVLGAISVLFFIMILIAGFNWLTAAGDSAKIEKAKKRIIAATVGLILIFAAYALVTMVFNAVEPPAGPQ